MMSYEQVRKYYTDTIKHYANYTVTQTAPNTYKYYELMCNLTVFEL